MANTAARATVESPTPGAPNRPDQPPKGPVRVIHNSTVTPNTANTRTSLDCQTPTWGRLRLVPPLTLRLSHRAINGKPQSTTGTPVVIHFAKVYSWPVNSL